MEPDVLHPCGFPHPSPGLLDVHQMVSRSLRTRQQIRVPLLPRQGAEQRECWNRQGHVVNASGLGLTEAQLTSNEVYIVPPRLEQFGLPYPSQEIKPNRC